jgi:hypothetical protein
MVGVARETSAIISDTTVEHLVDGSQGLPDAHAIVKPTLPKSKVPNGVRHKCLHDALTRRDC